jgi:hypothetical protein
VMVAFIDSHREEYGVLRPVADGPVDLL